MAPATTGTRLSELAGVDPAGLQGINGFSGPAAGAIVDWWNSWNIDFRSPVDIVTASDSANDDPNQAKSNNSTLLIVGAIVVAAFVLKVK